MIIVGTATYQSILDQLNLNEFDLNKDGFFSGSEITAQQQEAMKKAINDTGRNFSFIVGFIFSLIIATFVYVLGFIYLRIKSRNSRIVIN